MPHPKSRKVANDRFPKVRHHKPSGRAAVVLNGQWFYLGPWGSDTEEPGVEARAAYDKLLARWLAGGREPLSDDDPTGRNPAAVARLEPVKAGRCGVKKPRRVRPVSISDVQAVLPFLSSQIVAMIWLQWWTAARPGEICGMRGCDLDTSGQVWLYRPHHHKTEHLGKDRRIAIGPEGQKVLRPFLRPGVVFLFSPKDAERDRRKKLMAERTTPLWDSHRRARKAKRKRHPRKKPGECYTVSAYGRAISRACELAGISRWTPNQLRHSACTRIEREAGIEAARKVAGHAHPRTTAIYAETELQDIVKIAKQLG